MSRNIKTVECLKKHEGKTVKVIADNGSVFEATVELDMQGYPVLYTTSTIAADAAYWWSSASHKGYGHHCAKDFQITKELKSLTLLPSRHKKAKKASKDKKFLTCSEINAGIGHLCKLSDGQEAFIACSDRGTAAICMHSRSNGLGWSLAADDVAARYKESIKEYKHGWYVGCEGNAESIKVVEILGKPKAKKAKKSSEALTSGKKFLTRSEIKAGVGHFCKMSDGSEGFIVWSKVCPRVLLHQQQDGFGWGYSAAGEDDDNATAPESFRKQFKYAWNVGDDGDAKTIKVVEILDAREKSVDESPKKTLLDMTIREVLEKLDEIIKR